MPAPSSATYSVDVLVAAHTDLRDLIDGAATAGKVNIRSSADVLLATLALDDPCGTVDGGTGQLTITFPGGDTASVSGTAAYVEITDGDDNVKLSLPCARGSAAVSGYAVLNTLTIVAGLPVDILSITVG